jgi:hypothetical protein
MSSNSDGRGFTPTEWKRTLFYQYKRSSTTRKTQRQLWFRALFLFDLDVWSISSFLLFAQRYCNPVSCPVRKDLWRALYRNLQRLCGFQSSFFLYGYRTDEKKNAGGERAKESEEILPDLDLDWIECKSSIWGGVYFISVYIPLRLMLFFIPVSTL